MSMKPEIVIQPSFSEFSFAAEVADFTGGYRPAYRVTCHCRNCGWKGQARFKIRFLIPTWLTCPKCETEELSCHGAFLNRDTLTVDELEARHKIYRDRVRAELSTRTWH